VSGYDQILIKGERVVNSTGKHRAALLGDSLLAALMVLASFFLAGVFPDSSGPLLIFLNRVLALLRTGLFYFGCGWIIYNVVAWRSASYVVTNMRVFCNEGLVRHRSAETLLTSLTDIRT
jgi:hypothetical protein